MHGLLISSVDHVLEPGIDLPGSPFIKGHGVVLSVLQHMGTPMKPTTASQLKYLALFACIALATTPVLAQVSVGGGSGSSWLANKANVFYAVISGIAGILMTTAWTLAGYKFIFVDGTKLTDLKGLLIGGICCAGAAAWSYTMLS